MVSSEMLELIGMCDRILVMRGGQVTGEVSGPAMTEAKHHRTGNGGRECSLIKASPDFQPRPRFWLCW